uniref:hypothetical protein RF2 n=1 Tax=Gahnia tristis TaxID=388572 RepID=UPI001F12C1AC|nr:hypothetical protein RF2 [Gahnia tristis]YP_010290929.1 hypothetical protein RF2 [Gahnia tristis]ULQ66064.1 hypothetical protein RF2 [Gahnia tristis]ULQ66087.1 hypothetical protein RF2 [Gahnia tristis]
MEKKNKHERHDWITDWILEWREILREIKNSHSFTNIFFDQERFMKLFDSRIWSILLSHNSQGSRSNRYLTSKGLIIRDSRINNVVNRVHGVVKNMLMSGILLVVAVCISRLYNRNIVERKNIYLRGLLPIPMNSVGSREESFCSSNIHKLVVSLLYPPKGKTFSGSCFMDGESIIRVLPRNKKCIMRSSGWWRNQIRKKRDLTCNETVAGIEISFKENNSKYPEFLLLWHIDDPMVSWGKNQHESDFWLDNVWLGNKDRFVRKVQNILSNIQYDSTRSNFIQVKDSSQLKGSSDQSIESRLSAEGEKQMNNHLLPEEIEEFLGNPTRSIHSFFSDRWSELYLGSSPTEGDPRETAFWKRKPGVSFVPFRRRLEHKELVDLFKIIPYLQKTVLIRPILPGGYMVPKEKSNAEDRFAEMINLFILSITQPNPNLVYHSRFAFSIDSYRLDPKKFLNEIFDRFEYGIQKHSIGKDILNHRTIMKSTINQHLSNWAKSQKKWFNPLICRTQRSRNWYPDAYSKWSNEFQNLQEDLGGYFSSKQEKLQVVFDQLRRFYININEFLSYWYSIDWSEAYDIYDLQKSVRFFLPMARLFFDKSLGFFQFFAKFLYFLYPRLSVHIGNIAIHSSEIHISELKDPIHEKSLEPLSLQIVLLKKLKPFLLDDHNASKSKRLDDLDTSQGSNLLINEGRIFPFLFNEISKWMIDSFYTRKNRRKSFDNTDSYFYIIPHDRDNWLNPVKAFHRSSMISSFYKANRLGFLNGLHHFWFWVSCKKRFPFFVEKTRINNEDLTYRKFLNISFIRNKIFSLYVGKKKHGFLTLSGIESQVSDIKIPQDPDFPQSDDKKDQFYKRLMYKFYKFYNQFYNQFYRSSIFPRTLYPIQSDPVVYRASSWIADLLRLEKTSWQSFSDMNRSDSKVKNLHQYLSVNSNMEFESNPCSEKSLPSGKKEKWSLFRFRSKKKYVNKRRIQITIEKNLISVTLFEGNIEDNIHYLEWTINKECLLTIFTTSGFKHIRFILSEIFSYLIFPTVVSKIHDIIDIPWVILEKILMKWTLISDKISSHCLVQLLRRIICLFRISQKKSKSLNGSSRFFSVSISLFSDSYTNESLISDELLFSIPFLLLVAGYLACRGFIFIFQVSRELQRDLEKIKSLTNPSYIVELRKLLDRYPIPSFRSESLEKPLRVILEEYIEGFLYFLIELGSLPSDANSGLYDFSTYEITSRHSKEEYENRNLIDLLISYLTYLISYLRSLIPNNLIDRIIFVINTRHLSRTSKEIYSLIRKRKRVVKGGFMDDKIESWVANTDWVDDEEREFLIQLSTLRTEKRIDQILWSLTHSNLLYEIVEQPGSNYLRYLFEIQQKDLLNYEFNKSCLAERRIFLAYYETITSWGAFHLSSRPNPFSLRLAPYPSRSILVIGSIGIGRSYLVKSLAKNSYLPFIKIYPLKYPYLFNESSPNQDFDFDIDDLEDFKNEYITYIPFDIDDFGLDDIDDNLDLDKKLFNMTRDELTSNDPLFFDMTVQFDLAKTMSPCIIWIPNVHGLDRNELRYLSFHLEESSLSNSKDRERCFTRNIIVIASTHIPREVDPALIGPNKFNTFIKIRRLTIAEQRRYFLILSYTRGFGLENKIFDSKKFGSITMSSNARHLVALNNEVLSISITQRRYIIEETDPIRLALYRQTWDFQTHIRWVQDHRIFLYQIGRAFAQNVFLSNFSIDPISIYIKDPIAKNRIWNSYSYKWYVELETNLKKITILLYLLSCSAGLVTQDLWSSPGPDAKNWITSSEFVENDSHLVQSLLELEDFLVGSSWIEKNCSETLLLRSEPRNPLDMMQHRSFSIRYRRLKYEIDESEFEEGHEAVNPQQIEIENDFFNQNQIVRSPKIWRYLFDNLEIENIKRLIKSGLPYWAESFQGKWPFYHEEDKLQEEELQENDSEFLQSGTIQYQKREIFSKEQSFFLISRFIWEPSQPFFLLGLYFWLSRRELVPDENSDEKRSDLNEYPSSNLSENWFNKQEKNFELLIRRQRWQRRLRINSSLSKGSFPSHILFESYQYLANLFLSNERLLDQMTKTLLRNRWLLPEEMNHLIRGTGERFPIPDP